MKNIYIAMVGVCGTISFMLFDNTPAFFGWLAATCAYGLAAMERS
jgi:hypothetical protein